jgi:16S rRNA processing protein RimM
MIDLSDCTELGDITRCHGIHGEVVLQLSNLQYNDIINMESVFIEIDGSPVPFFVTSYKERTTDTLALSFDDIHTEEQAREILNCRVFIDSSQIIQDKLQTSSADNLIGYTLVDEQFGELGSVDEIMVLENNPLIKVRYKNRELLIPFHKHFILRIDHKKSILYIKTPEGLLDIN